MKEVNLLNDIRRQSLTLTGGNAVEVPASNMAAQRAREGTPDTGDHQQNKRGQEHRPATDRDGEWHRQEITDGHKQRWVCEEVRSPGGF